MSTAGTIACCICGVGIKPNKVNMCLTCLRDRVDITDGVSKEETVLFCKTCGKHGTRDNKGNLKYVACELESPELLALCLKAIHGLGKGKKDSATLVDARWIWTEPHSKRLKIELEIEKEVMNGAMLRQRMVTEFIVQYKQCSVCTKETVDQRWNTIVQVRQKVQHKRTLLHLEQMLAGEKIVELALDIIPCKNGLDFYFSKRNDALKFCEGLLQLVPARRKKESKSHVGTDSKSNITRFKYTMVIEVSPICKYDLVVLSKKLQNSLFGGQSAVVICDQVTTALKFIDTSTKAEGLLKKNFFDLQALKTARDLVEFIVLDVDILDKSFTSADNSSTAEPKNHYVLAEVEVAKADDFGVNDNRFVITSHLGKYLHSGDTVLGYDLTDHNFPDELLAPLRGAELPDIILVKKKKVKNTSRPPTTS
mmetsp:Transcript_10444/g.11973  ORF Transcript_10444/g.11973 Transcript_10444/m.11973 type:complete len:423 (+) Transcript_10444:219-1487(+)|eukprot:CAMPEP_0184020762 /NCGR_PEP_ID=MMETSP0954-20121128/9535_1 /TAXON_ID=627963 /ORGANISM="Aplanochytrium sp, Strain PBS07" /LENGTH=422 /DNA_ID=CAMNT_0026302671 /DNA_START=187 /DNA_END=1455 /DNA_ORIENTATION=-